VFLRESQDKYWQGNTPQVHTGVTWSTAPLVRNMERWVVQTDAPTDGQTSRGLETYKNLYGLADMGQSWEGRRTNIGSGDKYIYFQVDNQWISTSTGTIITFHLDDQLFLPLLNG
jgi:hypothetical protein